MDAKDFERRLVELLRLEHSDEPIERVDEIVFGMSRADLSDLTEAFPNRSWGDAKIAPSLRGSDIHDRMVELLRSRRGPAEQ